MDTTEEEIMFLQVTPPTPAPAPPSDEVETTPPANPTVPCEGEETPVANLPEPRGEKQRQRIFEPFAPEVRHVLRHILRVDPEMSEVALALEQAGIYNGDDLCMFSNIKIENFNCDSRPLKPIYIWKLKNVTK